VADAVEGSAVAFAFAFFFLQPPIAPGARATPSTTS